MSENVASTDDAYRGLFIAIFGLSLMMVGAVLGSISVSPRPMVLTLVDMTIHAGLASPIVVFGLWIFKQDKENRVQ